MTKTLATLPKAVTAKAQKGVVIVTPVQLEKLLFAITGQRTIRVLTKTLVRMRKTNNRYFNRVYKTQEHRVVVNFDYEAMVNRRRLAEGKQETFQAAERTWGQHLPSSCLVFKDNQYYMQAAVEKSDVAQYTFRGRPIAKELFETHIIRPSKPRNQGLEDDVIIRSFAIVSVLEVVVGNVRYRVRESARKRHARAIALRSTSQAVLAAAVEAS